VSLVLAITSNYAQNTDDPAPHMRRAAEAGFGRLMWAHHAWSDYLYTDAEIDYIARCLREFHLELNDLHCPTGREQRWGSPVEYQRLAGVELVKNRIAMAARLGTDVVVCHPPSEPDAPAARSEFWDRQRRTMDVLCPYARERGVRVALENCLPGNFDTLEKFFAIYPPDVMGLCYDSGHGSARVDWPGNGLERLARLKDRVVDFHLHDNGGAEDEHRLPFTGVVDWQRLARILPTTSYRKPVVPLEASMEHSGIADPEEFLRQAAAAGRRLADLFEANK
jgi:sugar phosphate isomerase/epimerase